MLPPFCSDVSFSHFLLTSFQFLLFFSKAESLSFVSWILLMSLDSKIPVHFPKFFILSLYWYFSTDVSWTLFLCHSIVTQFDFFLGSFIGHRHEYIYKIAICSLCLVLQLCCYIILRTYCGGLLSSNRDILLWLLWIALLYLCLNNCVWDSFDSRWYLVLSLASDCSTPCFSLLFLVLKTAPSKKVNTTKATNKPKQCIENISCVKVPYPCPHIFTWDVHWVWFALQWSSLRLQAYATPSRLNLHWDSSWLFCCCLML